MHLTPREQERLFIHVAADVARRRRARGLKLNYPEAVAILTAEIARILESSQDAAVRPRSDAASQNLLGGN